MRFLGRTLALHWKFRKWIGWVESRIVGIQTSWILLDHNATYLTALEDGPRSQSLNKESVLFPSDECLRSRCFCMRAGSETNDSCRFAISLTHQNKILLDKRYQVVFLTNEINLLYMLYSCSHHGTAVRGRPKELWTSLAVNDWRLKGFHARARACGLELTGTAGLIPTTRYERLLYNSKQIWRLKKEPKKQNKTETMFIKQPALVWWFLSWSGACTARPHNSTGNSLPEH